MNKKSKATLPSFPQRIGITGSPGTGKKTIGQELAKKLGLEFFSINDHAIAEKWGNWNLNEFEVDQKKVSGEIPTKNRVIAGHLLPYIVPNKHLDWVFI